METIETEKILTAAEMFGIVGDELREKNAEIERLRDALSEAIEFADQDYHALTPTGETMISRWRSALTLRKASSIIQGEHNEISAKLHK